MAASRPLVTVFQELAQPSVEPDVPDLNSVLVGPAMVIKDFPDDAADIELAANYGREDAPAAGPDQYQPPASTDDALLIGAFPGNAPGARVLPDSVRIVLKLPRVILGTTYAISGVPSLGSAAEVFSAIGAENLVTFAGVGSLTALGVAPGDTLVMTSSNPVGVGAGPQTVVRTVLSVGEPNVSGVPTDLTSLRVSQNLPPTGTGADEFLVSSAVEVRIERRLPTQAYTPGPDGAGFFDAGSDRYTIRGGAALQVSIGGSNVARVVAHAGVYLAYVAHRQDLIEPVAVSNGDRRTDAQGRAYFPQLGLIDARNPLGVGMHVALQNAGSAVVYAMGVPTNDINGHAEARAVVDSRTSFHTFAPLVEDLQVIGGYAVEWKTLADPAIAERDGVPQKFRCVLGSTPLASTRVVGEASITGIAEAPAGSSTGLCRTLTLRSSTAPDITSVQPGDRLVIGLVTPTGTWTSRRGVHTVSHVNKGGQNIPEVSDEATVEIVPGTSRWDDATPEATTAATEVRIVSPTGGIKYERLAKRVLMVTATQGLSVTMREPTTVGGPYRLAVVENGSPTVTVSISGFDVTLGCTLVSATTSDLAVAINAHPVLKTLMEATLFGTSVAVGVSIPFSSIHVAYLEENYAQAGTGIHVELRNYLTNVRVAFSNAGAGGSGAVVTVAGNDVTVTYEDTVSTLAHIVTALNDHAVARTLLIASRIGGDATATLMGALTIVNDAIKSWTNAAIAANDDLYLRLYDANARFLSSGARVGDVIEIPVDPNDYSPAAFEGRLLAYRIAQVISENRVGVQNLGDDTGSAANELPHLYLRDFRARRVDNETASTPSAIHYRVTRALDKDEQVRAKIAEAQSLATKRAVLCFPDLVDVADLKDGSLPRAVATVRAPARSMPGWVIACQVAGALAALPVHHGLTNLGFAGVSKIYHSSGYFRERQLTMLSNGGLFVMHQPEPTALPYCIHQLTTDVSALETGELSVVRNVDFLSIYYQQILGGFIGPYNVLPETLIEMQTACDAGSQRLMARSVGKIGAPLLSAEITTIRVSTVNADRVYMVMTANIPRPLNGVEFHLVV